MPAILKCPMLDDVMGEYPQSIKLLLFLMNIEIMFVEMQEKENGFISNCLESCMLFLRRYRPTYLR